MGFKVLITGGAGYIGSALVAALLKRGNHVTVLDDLWFGGDSLIPFLSFDTFRLIKCEICADAALPALLDGVDCVVHLAAIVGFPACEKAGYATVTQVNVEGTKKVYQASTRAGVRRLIFASSYSNYGESTEGKPVSEEAPVYPKSLYAESKIEAERYLLNQTDRNSTTPVCLRLATVFGISPRMRFDLMVNQFVLEAYTKELIKLYEGNFRRSFIHVRDVARAIMVVIDAPVDEIRNQVFNVGSEHLNTTKQEIVELIRTYLPQLKVEYLVSSFSGDVRSLHLSFEKLRRILKFETKISLEQGIEELLWVLRHRIILNPLHEKYRNHPPILT